MRNFDCVWEVTNCKNTILDEAFNEFFLRMGVPGFTGQRETKEKEHNC
jgi:hypothetical protein